MFELIENLPEELTLVLIEHDIDLALELVDSVSCMDHGQIIAEDDPEGIRANPKVQEVYLGKTNGESNHAT
jgi:branched-chain amino acid transport system ATP-binding protein